MIEYVERFAVSHLAEVGLFATAFTIGLIMRTYGRYLERRTREHNRAWPNES